MKTNYVDMRKRYELAEKHVWNSLAPWKKEAIQTDRQLNRSTSLLEQFIKDIITIAENPDMPLNDVYPSVPEVTQSVIVSK